jgi:hypothetical protein
VVKWLKSLFAWQEVFRAGVYIYEENKVTGKRRCFRYIKSGYSPRDMDWLEKRDPKQLVPPIGGSYVR